MTQPAPPFLSVVITARHDNYGGDFRERIATPLRFNHDKLSERGVPYEVVLVEWDPVEGRPLLCEMLAAEMPDVTTGLLRTVVVASQYQAAMTQNPRVPYLEYVAKNVGLRRARAPFLLATNADILLGREAVDAIAERRLQPGTMYRAPRYDIKLGVDQAGLRWAALEDQANQVRKPSLRRPLLSSAAADFLLSDRDTFHRLRGFNEVYRAARVGIDTNFMVKVHGAGVPIVEIGGAVYHVNHVGSLRVSKVLHRDNRLDSPWGDLDWRSEHVTYNNPDGWGLGAAPSRQRDDGVVFLDFDWRAVPPLVDLRRIAVPARMTVSQPV
jgi:hypothetical protein